MAAVQLYEDYKARYTQGYEQGYTDALADVAQMREERRQRQAARRAAELRRRKAFLKQRLLGLVAAVFTVLAPMLLDGDATICVITAPMALALLFSKDYMLNDGYMDEFRERSKKQW